METKANIPTPEERKRTIDEVMEEVKDGNTELYEDMQSFFDMHKEYLPDSSRKEIRRLLARFYNYGSLREIDKVLQSLNKIMEKGKTEIVNALPSQERENSPPQIKGGRI